MNARVKVNGFSGVAQIETDQNINTITSEIATGLPRYVEELTFKNNSTRYYQYVVAPITIGTRRFETTFKGFIFEDVAQDMFGSSSNSNPLFEVVLGMDFIEENNLRYNSGVNAHESRAIGITQKDTNRKFERVDPLPDYTTTDYETEMDDRVILLFDMDCFEVQVHQEEWMVGQPRVVVNSADKIVAVSYEAKQMGINREATPYLRDAEEIYENVIPIYLPTRHSIYQGGNPRPDYTKTREATAKIVSAIKFVLSTYDEGMTTFQFSSNDEFYVDLTCLVDKISDDLKQNVNNIPMSKFWKKTYLYNGSVNMKPTPKYIGRRIKTLGYKWAGAKLKELEQIESLLLIGSTIGCKIVKEILNQTGYQASVGIGSNKLISKIASGIHKPGSITIFAPSGFDKFSQIVKMEDIPGLGGKTGKEIKNYLASQFGTYDIKMSHLQQVDIDELVMEVDINGCAQYEKVKQMLDAAHGICYKPIVPRNCYKTCGVTHSLYNRKYGLREIAYILKDECEEIYEKLTFEHRVNLRKPKSLKWNLHAEFSKNNINSSMQLHNGGRLPTARTIYNSLLQSANPRLHTLPFQRPIKFKDCSLTATY